MRRLLLAALLASAPGLALADESISGQWQADLGHHVLIAMDVLGDGHWTSQTVQNNHVVAEMAGTYDQQKASDTRGTIVFTPVHSRTSREHGAAQVERDKYAVEQGGSTLRLVSSNDDVMIFRKQSSAR